MYKAFSPLGEINYFEDNVYERPNQFRIQFANITDDRIKETEGSVTVNDIEYSFFHFNDQAPNLVPNQPNPVGARVSASLLAPVMLGNHNNMYNALNDDSLLEVFSQLSLRDICAVAGTCLRFNAVAMQYFRTKYARHRNYLDHLDSTSLTSIEQFLRTFGHKIIAFEIDPVRWRRNIIIILGLIADHCKNIKHLSVQIPCLKESSVTILYRLMTRLRSLELKSPLDEFEFLNGDWPLTMLSLWNNAEADIQMELPKLTKIHLFDWRSDRAEITGDTIRTLRICSGGIGASMLNSLPEDLPNLRQLTFENCGRVERMLAYRVQWNQLESLKSLRLLCKDPSPFYEMIVRDVARCRVPLTNLELDCASFDMIGSIIQIRTIERIRFRKCFEQEEGIDRQLISFVRNMVNLSSMYLEFDYPIAWMKKVLRETIQHIKSSIEFVFSEYGRLEIDQNDCTEITGLLRPHTKLKVTLQVLGPNLVVSAIIIRYLLCDVHTPCLIKIIGFSFLSGSGNYSNSSTQLALYSSRATTKP